jgi:hypothetical protein
MLEIIGSRDDIAEAEFMSAKFFLGTPYNEAMLIAYSAKKRAQSAAGVGEKTDLFVINSNGPILATDEDVRHIQIIWEEKQKMEQETFAATAIKMGDYINAHLWPQPASPVTKSEGDRIGDNNDELPPS